MGLLDSIKGFLNPMVISGFNDLFDNHYDALKYSCAAKDLSKDIPFNKKKEIVAKREAILKAYQQHLVRIEQERKKKAVVAAAAKYPHGFVIICDRYIGGVLGQTVKRMPGTRKSFHERQQYFDRNKSMSSILAINLEDYFSGNRRVYDNNINISHINQLIIKTRHLLTSLLLVTRRINSSMLIKLKIYIQQK